MSRQPRAGGRYVPPLDIAASQSAVADTYVSPEAPHGTYTLVAGSTYRYLLGGADAPFLTAHVTWDVAIIITSITIEDSNMHENDVRNFSTTAGDWIDEDPTTAFVGLVGAGATATNGVVNVSGGAVGGAMFHIGETGVFRTALTFVVGATGGAVRVSSHGKM